jgi:serine/threonine protein kinase
MIFQMLAGRPPVWAEESEGNSQVFQKIVTFSTHRSFPDSISEKAKDLINNLMAKDPAERFGSSLEGYQKLKQHSFFTGLAFEDIHEKQAPTITSGKIAPTKHKAWSRRKFSMYTAPLPQTYNFTEKFKMDIILEENINNVDQ